MELTPKSMYSLWYTHFSFALSSQSKKIKECCHTLLFCLHFRHCQELRESRDIITGLLHQFEELSGINGVFLLLFSCIND